MQVFPASFQDEKTSSKILLNESSTDDSIKISDAKSIDLNLKLMLKKKSLFFVLAIFFKFYYMKLFTKNKPLCFFSGFLNVIIEII